MEVHRELGDFSKRLSMCLALEFQDRDPFRAECLASRTKASCLHAATERFICYEIFWWRRRRSRTHTFRRRSIINELKATGLSADCVNFGAPSLQFKRLV